MAYIKMVSTKREETIRWKNNNNNEMNINATGCENQYWTQLVQNRGKVLLLVNKVQGSTEGG